MVEDILEKKFNKQEILNQIGLKDDEELKELINKEIEEEWHLNQRLKL